MEYRRLGRSGLKLSALSYGSWVTFARQVDVGSAKEMLTTAYDAGVNFFDNAEGYEQGRSKIVMGQAIAELGWSRDSFIVSSKVFWGGVRPTQRGLSAKHVTEACHAALKRLQVDHLDLYFCHRPDLDTPIEGTVRAMHNLVLQGKVLYWGTSEWTAQQITEAHAAAARWHLTPPVVEQPQYNLFERQKIEADFLPLYETYGLGTTTWSPLFAGLLTGKYAEGIPQESRAALPFHDQLRNELASAAGKDKLAKVRRLSTVAAEAGLSLTHMSLAWCLKNPNVSSVILGASRPAQRIENIAALSAVPQMIPDVMEAIEAVMQTRPDPPRRF